MSDKYEVRCFDPYSSDEVPESDITYLHSWFRYRDHLRRMKTLYKTIYVIIHKTIKEEGRHVS